jgi:hypothetical protein
MSVDLGVGVAVMSAQKMPAAKMGHTPAIRPMAKTRFQRQDSTYPIEASGKQGRIERRTALQPSRMFLASLTHYSIIRIA